MSLSITYPTNEATVPVTFGARGTWTSAGSVTGELRKTDNTLVANGVSVPPTAPDDWKVQFTGVPASGPNEFYKLTITISFGTGSKSVSQDVKVQVGG